MHHLRIDEPADAAALRERLRHVFWLGGGSGAGKSTVARRLAERHGMSRYATDDVMGDHAARTTPEEAPRLHDFLAMDMDERWLNRTPRDMLDTFHWFQGEGFALIVEDLLRLPPERAVIAEGFRLLPRLVSPLLADPAHAVWLLPTPEFRRSAIRSRSLPEDGFVRRTSDPAKARRNLAERDRMFTRHLEDEADRLRLRTLHVDTTLSEDALTERVSTAFRL
ncbi:AAA family ATPase [Streptomyces alkaliterrae]|uniref:AAA family ATPase n=1 Tax=Streptomyces alkaliterrae TaxID=2213162 RepID=A0A5P0YVY5_9ACTN|nr:AAA family ATPase [Streptomyces alkaliterrae]MBB1259053.1 AAA family ATPase [Streptomyces alkaliterrae]MQS04453.1 AAA family ATPase [Streptomyces alkaliterrae]